MSTSRLATAASERRASPLRASPLRAHAAPGAGQPGVTGLVDVAGSVASWGPPGPRALPSLHAVLSIGVVGEIRSERDDRAGGAVWLSGVATRPFGYRLPAELHAVIVLLEPWVIPAWFGLDAGGLVDRRIDLRDGIGAAPVARLLSAVRRADTPKGRMMAVRRWAAALAPRAGAPPPALRDARLADRDAAGLARALGVSLRQSERLVQRHHGVTLREMKGIRRFQRALEHFEEDLSWAALSADAGFADQSHLCRAVRRYAGMTPAALRGAARGSWIAPLYRPLGCSDRVVAI
ncbi:helix-turn-helix domain-containing protein [Sorangium sp. So ce1078]|uniref:helix-turn-helix domain-containing protein n=1 Tax=Sorangium sp. So ce1078 TaxID=3133329 RepID=UPI003F629FB1